MLILNMELKKLLLTLHKTIELQEMEDISQEKMAKRINVSHSTYRDYRRGINEPMAMKALLNMLNMVSDDEIIKIVRKWKK